MPELGPKNLDFIKQVRVETKERGGLGPLEWRLEEIAKEYNEKYIGSGAEVVVVEHESSPTKVVAFNYKDISPEMAKKIFYLQRFFSTLFPHNFPHFYASAGKDSNSKNEGKNVSGTIRHKIEKGSQTTTHVAHSFEEVYKVCQELGIQLYLDGFGGGILGDDGGEYYVDTIKESNVEEWDMDLIVQYMKNKMYRKEDIYLVKLSIQKLKSLN